MIKNSEDIKGMKLAGKLAAQTLEMIGEHVKPGISTGELDKICHDFIVDEIDCIPAPLNYKGFPKSICTSINQVVCHGIPSENRILKSNDIINIDVTVIKDGYHGDTSKMFMVGKAQPHAQRLVDILKNAFIAVLNKLSLELDWVTLVMPFKSMPRAIIIQLLRSTADMALAKSFMKIHKFCITATQYRHVLTRRHVLYHRPMINLGTTKPSFPKPMVGRSRLQMADYLPNGNTPSW